MVDKVMSTPKITGDRIKKYLAEGKRFDGRKPEEFRELEIETGFAKNAEGSARVKLGKTEVIVGVKMNTGTPYPDSPEKGNMMVTTELLPLSSPRFETGPPRIEAIELGRVTDRGIRESKFIQFDKLCIEKGEKVWTVFIDVYPINEDGNLLDAANIGAIAALKDAKMPVYDEKEGIVKFGEWTKDKLSLAKELPISVTVHKIGDHFIVDPTREEEDLSEARVTIGASAEGNISSMQKGEAAQISMEDMSKIMDLSEKVHKEIFKKLDKVLK